MEPGWTITFRARRDSGTLDGLSAAGPASRELAAHMPWLSLHRHQRFLRHRATWQQPTAAVAAAGAAVVAAAEAAEAAGAAAMVAAMIGGGADDAGGCLAASESPESREGGGYTSGSDRVSVEV